MSKKEKIDRCIECHEPLDELDGSFFCDNLRCYRYGLATLVFMNEVERKLN